MKKWIQTMLGNHWTPLIFLCESSTIVPEFRVVPSSTISVAGTVSSIFCVGIEASNFWWHQQNLVSVSTFYLVRKMCTMNSIPRYSMYGYLVKKSMANVGKYYIPGNSAGEVFWFFGMVKTRLFWRLLVTSNWETKRSRLVHHWFPLIRPS